MSRLQSNRPTLQNQAHLKLFLLFPFELLSNPVVRTVFVHFYFVDCFYFGFTVERSFEQLCLFWIKLFWLIEMSFAVRMHFVK